MYDVIYPFHRFENYLHLGEGRFSKMGCKLVVKDKDVNGKKLNTVRYLTTYKMFPLGKVSQ